ncbi:MAG: PAS domain S-box [Methanobacterium sp. Maddingley MBC34]|nr:MAG: PAS domain S-box [Methanobacterium sp. Maddingley MBC34]
MSPKKKNNVPEEVLDNISDAFVSVDPNFIVTYINKPAEEFLGKKRNDVTGKNILEAFPQTKNTVFSDIFLQMANEKDFAKREKFEFETLFDEPPLKKWYNVRVFPYKKGFNIFFQNITSRKTAELKLIKSEEKYKSMLENIPDSHERELQWSNLISNLPGIVYRCKNDNNWTMTFISHQCNEIIGYAPSDLINNAKKAYKDLIFEEDRETVWNTVQNALKKNEPYETNYRIITRQNEVRWVWERGVGVEDEKGELFLEGFIEDINDSKMAEKLLRISEGKYRHIFENAMEGIFQSTPEGKYISVNPAFARIGGFDSPEDMIDSVPNIKDLYVHPEDRDQLIEQLQNQEGVNNFETEIKRKDGSLIWITTNVMAVRDKNGKLKYLQGSIIDISQRKHVEEILRRKEEKLRLIIDSSQDFIYSYDMQGRFTSANKSISEEMKINQDEIIGKTHRELGFPEKICKEWDDLHGRVHENNSTVTVFTSTTMPGDQIRDYEVVLNPLHDRNGNIIGISGITRDVTERQKAEEALKESEEKYRALFESDPDYTILLGWDGYLLDVNPAATQITGLSKEELVGNHFMDLTIFPEEELSSHKEMFSHFINDKTIAPYESRIYDYEGKIRWIEIKQTSIKKDGEISYILLICSDITQRKKAENEIRDSLKEKEVLLQEIHHRVKNNMQIISSLLNLQKQYVDEEEAVNVLMESQNRVKSMAMIHEKLYQSHNLTSINISDYVKSLVKDLFSSYSTPASQIKALIEIDDVKLNIETSVPCGLIISELVSNSLKYAFPSGREGEISLSLKSHGKRYELIISDNGIGFPEDIDFKNTESLGLQLVNSLVGQIDGEIKLERSKGTMFKITFSELIYKERI